MLQLRDGARFAREPRYCLIVVGVFGANDLDGDFAPELTITRAIHHGCGAAAKLAEYLVVTLEIGCRDVCVGIAKHQPARKSRGWIAEFRTDGTATAIRRLALVKDEGDLAHLDAITLGQDDR
jgi:hypothetical protein